VTSSVLRFRLKTWGLIRLGAVPLALYVLSFPGCSGGGTSSATIAYQSTRAQSGADAQDGPLEGTFNIWVMNSVGSGTRPLTNFPHQAEPFNLIMAWSPDGHKIAFDSHGALDGSSGPAVADNIWVVNSDGSGATPLTKLSTLGADSSQPIWSPDGSKLVFTSARALDGTDAVNFGTPDGAEPGSTSNIWVINADGSGAAPLTRITANQAVSLDPAWSPDGKKLAFASSRALDGTNAVNGFSCSPQQTQLVCPVFNIWVMNADGSGATPLTKFSTLGADSIFPIWSPDGSRLVFISGGQNIWVINADGSGAAPLTANGAAFDPAWSPDGTKLAFDSPTGSFQMFNIWVMNADGSNATPLTKLTFSRAYGPAWSPDGSELVFTSNRALDGTDAIVSANGVNIWVMNADGSNVTPLTKLTQAACISPRWNPTITP